MLLQTGNQAQWPAWSKTHWLHHCVKFLAQDTLNCLHNAPLISIQMNKIGSIRLSVKIRRIVGERGGRGLTCYELALHPGGIIPSPSMI